MKCYIESVTEAGSEATACPALGWTRMKVKYVFEKRLAFFQVQLAFMVQNNKWATFGAAWPCYE